jgi:hypothetical protein
MNAKYMLIANDGSDAVSGTFTGLSEGSLLVSGIYAFKVSYRGGDGNDVVLTLLNFNHLPLAEAGGQYFVVKARQSLSMPLTRSTPTATCSSTVGISTTTVSGIPSGLAVRQPPTAGATITQGRPRSKSMTVLPLEQTPHW